jgi:hypothetical protein
VTITAAPLSSASRSVGKRGEDALLRADLAVLRPGR